MTSFPRGELQPIEKDAGAEASELARYNGLPMSLQTDTVRVRRHFWCLVLLWIACAACMWIRDRAISGPFIFGDEATYFNLGRTIYTDHNYGGHTQYNPLYPLIISPFFALGTVLQTYAAVRILNALLWCSAIFPLFLTARKLMDGFGFSLLIALAGVASPLSAIAPMVWAEPLLYPLLAWSVYFAVVSFDRDDAPPAVVAGLACGLTFLTKQGGLVVGAAIAVALLFRCYSAGWRGERFKAGFVFISSFFFTVSPWLVRNAFTPNAGLIGYSPWVQKMGVSALSLRLLDALGCTLAYLIAGLFTIGFVYFVIALVSVKSIAEPARSYLVFAAAFFGGEAVLASLIAVVVPFHEKQAIFFPAGRYAAMALPYALIAAGVAASQKKNLLRASWRLASVICAGCILLVYLFSPLRAVNARAALDAPDMAVWAYALFHGTVLWGDIPHAVTALQRAFLALLGAGFVAGFLLLKNARSGVVCTGLLMAFSGVFSAFYIRNLAAVQVDSNRLATYLVAHNTDTPTVAFDPDMSPTITPFGFWFPNRTAMITIPASDFRGRSCFDFGAKTSPVADGCVPIQAPWLGSSLYNQMQGFGFEPGRIDTLLSYYQPQTGKASGLEDFVYGAKQTKFLVNVPEGSLQVGIWACITDAQFSAPVDYTVRIGGDARHVKRKAGGQWNTFIRFDRVTPSSGMVTVDFDPAAGSVWVVNKLVAFSAEAPPVPSGVKYYVTTKVVPLLPVTAYGELRLYRITAPISVDLGAGVKPASAASQEHPLRQFLQELSSQIKSLTLKPGENTEIPISIKNTSGETWHLGGKFPIDLAYVWLSGEQIVAEGPRTILPKELAPGESAIVAANVAAPAKGGRLDLQFSMVQEGVTWFFTAGAKPLRIPVTLQ